MDGQMCLGKRVLIGYATQPPYKVGPISINA
jgi:hypothetical protein